MKDNISNIFSINNKNLIIDESHSYENLYLFNDDFCFNCELSNNTVNLTDFILMNEFMLLPNNVFYLGTKNDNGELVSIKVNNHAKESMCYKLKIASSKHEYYFNIYYAEKGYLKVSIKRDQETINKLDIHSIFFDDTNKLNITITATEEETITEAGIVLFSKECEMIPVSVNEVIGNNATFKIDLNLLLNEKNNSFTSKFHSNLILNGKIYPINIEKALFHTSILSNEGVHSNISIFSSSCGYLTFTKSNYINLAAYLENAYLSDNKLVMEVKISSNLDILNSDLFNTKLKIDKQDITFDLVENTNNLFKFEISLDDINTLRNIHNPLLRLKLVITSKEDGKEFIDYLAHENSTLNIKEYINCPSSLTIPVSISADNRSTYLNVCNAIDIKSVTSIKIRKNSLELQFNTYNSIKENNFKLSIMADNVELNARSIKKCDDNNFTCVFKDNTTLNIDALNSIANNISSNGLTVKTILNEKEYLQLIPGSKKINITNIKGYLPDLEKHKQNCLNSCKKIFSKAVSNKKTSDNKNKGER